MQRQWRGKCSISWRYNEILLCLSKFTEASPNGVEPSAATTVAWKYTCFLPLSVIQYRLNGGTQNCRTEHARLALRLVKIDTISRITTVQVGMKARITPRLCCVFQNCIVYQYAPGRRLCANDLERPDIIRYVGFGCSWSLQWRHNERDGVSNHRRLDGLLYRLFKCTSNERRQSSASLAFARGIHRWPVQIPLTNG